MACALTAVSVRFSNFLLRRVLIEHFYIRFDRYGGIALHYYARRTAGRAMSAQPPPALAEEFA